MDLIGAGCAPDMSPAASLMRKSISVDSSLSQVTRASKHSTTGLRMTTAGALHDKRCGRALRHGTVQQAIWT